MLAADKAPRTHVNHSNTIEHQMPHPIGDWATDTQRGRDFADTLVERMKTTQNPTLLGRLVKNLVADGRYSGVEVGFFQRISERI